MPKRDYKSYNILDDEITEEDRLNTDEEGNEQGEEKQEDGQTGLVLEKDFEKVNEEADVRDTLTAESVQEVEKNLSEAEGSNEYQREEAGDIEQAVNEEHQHRAEKINLDEAENKATEEKHFFNKDNVKSKEQVDMSFEGYKVYSQSKERSRLAKWSIRLIKVIIIIMLLPFIAILAMGALTFLGGFMATILGCATVGFVILGSTCFMATQISAGLVALGVSVAITAFSFSGILLVLFCMLIKGVSSLLKRSRKVNMKSFKEEGR